MKQAQVIISGTVQGVGYRYFVAEKAEALGIVGWVKNKKDGTVEALFQTPGKSDQEGQYAIMQLIEQCRQGPPLSEIERIDEKWEDVEENEQYEMFELH